MHTDLMTEEGLKRYCAARAAEDRRRHEEWRQWRREQWGSAQEEEDYQRNHAGRGEPGDPEPGFTVAEHRRQMHRHHPDKGGDREKFEQWRRRFQAARSGRRP